MPKVVNVVTNAFPASTSLPALTLDGNYIAAGASKTLLQTDNRAVVKLDTVGGSTVTLPAATGAGIKFKFLVTVLATTTSHKIQVANSVDVMIGSIIGARQDSSNAALIFSSTGTSDTITLNRSTTGSVTLGEWVEAEDVATNTWSVTGMLTSTGSPFATPFSAAV